MPRIDFLRAAIVLFCTTVIGCASPVISSDGRPIHLNESQVRQMLGEMVEDESKSIMGVMHAFSYRAFGFFYNDAEARLLAGGRQSFETVLTIVSRVDDDLSPRQRECAWNVLIDSDPIRALPPLMAARAARQISDEFTVHLLDVTLPARKLRRDHPDDKEFLEWIYSRLRQYGASELYLKILDEEFKPPYETIYELPLLNRRYGQDIDQWLAANAPSAARLRTRMLKFGCDPMRELADDGQVELSLHRLDTLANRLFAGSQDRAAFKELATVPDRLRSTSNGESPIFEPKPGGLIHVINPWELRLHAWYEENRNRFVYDPNLLRFVVR